MKLFATKLSSAVIYFVLCAFLTVVIYLWFLMDRLCGLLSNDNIFSRHSSMLII